MGSAEQGGLHRRGTDRRVLSGIIFVNRNCLRWQDAPAAYRPHGQHPPKTIAPILIENLRRETRLMTTKPVTT